MAQHRYDVYGLTGMELAEARSLAESALGLEFSERESSYYGGIYYKHRLDTGREAILFSNIIATRSGRIRERHKGYSVLLEVSDLEQMDDIQQRLTNSSPSFALLETSTIDDSE